MGVRRSLRLAMAGGAIAVVALYAALDSYTDVDGMESVSTGLQSRGVLGPPDPGNRQKLTDLVDPGDLLLDPVTARELWADPIGSGRPWSDLGAVEGLLTFRGNPSRTFYGRGPVPDDPTVIWSYEIGCSFSSVAGERKQWCGTGWTGQPVVFRAPPTARSSDQWWVAFGAYNRSVNVLQARSGRPALEPFTTGDIIKGSVTADPDGFPLLYSGSRDNFLHVIAIDGAEPRELWRLGANDHGPTLWNNDWDGSALVVDDYLLVGGENSRFYVVRLNRDFDRDGRVTVDPEVLFSGPGWDEQLLADVGDNEVSIENSVVLVGSVMFFANSAGLVQGWELEPVLDGREPERVFRYWVGDDVDASLVADGDGGLYVAAEYERVSDRSKELGQLIKLDISEPLDDPLLWGVELQTGVGSGLWATPALWGDLVIAATDDGRIVGLDQDSGEQRWVIELTPPLWSSPVVVDDVLIQGDCSGLLNAFDLPTGAQSGSGTAEKPTLRWSVQLDGCIESTPAVWDGSIYVGTRGGTFYALAERRSGPVASGQAYSSGVPG